MTDFIYERFAKNYLQDLLSPYVQVEVDREVIDGIKETGDNSPFKQFSKGLFSVLLSPYGTVEIDKELPPPEPKYIPVYCTPSANTIPTELGLVGRFLDKNALFHPFFTPVEPFDIRHCISILFALFQEYKVDEKGKEYSVDEEDLPCAWILLPTVSESLIDGFVAKPCQEDWGKGVYFLPPIFRGRIVAIDELPKTYETLWLRLLTKGEVLLSAIDELEALPQGNVLRFKALNSLMGLYTNLQASQDFDNYDQDLVARLSRMYRQEMN